MLFFTLKCYFKRVKTSVILDSGWLQVDSFYLSLIQIEILIDLELLELNHLKF